MAKFEKGKSGNPNGRPKVGASLSEFIRAWLETEDPETRETRLLQILDATAKKGLQGDMQAVKILLERGYGSVIQSVDVTSRADVALSPDELKAIQIASQKALVEDTNEDS